MDRFVRVYSQGIVDVVEIWVDMETGVNYMWRKAANAGGLTPLLDENGNVVVTKAGMDVSEWQLVLRVSVTRNNYLIKRHDPITWVMPLFYGDKNEVSKISKEKS